MRGAFRWARKDELTLKSNYVLVATTGVFELGTKDAPWTGKMATIFIKNDRNKDGSPIYVNIGGNRPEPSNPAPTGADSIPPAHPHVRPMGVPRACRRAGRNQENTRLKNTISLCREHPPEKYYPFAVSRAPNGDLAHL